MARSIKATLRWVEPPSCRCKICGKTPDEILKYRAMVLSGEYATAEEAVRKEEPTYNPNTGLFYCTTCQLCSEELLGKA